MGGPFQGDCACRGPGNDRYTRFPFHPLFTLPWVKMGMLKVGERKRLEKSTMNIVVLYILSVNFI